MENAAGSRLLGKPGDPAVAVLMGSNAPPREAGGLRGQRAWGGGMATLAEENLTHLCQTVTRLGSSRGLEEQRLSMDSA